MTLAEVVIGAFLAALLLTVLIQLLVPTLRHATQTYRRLDHSQVAARVLRSLQADLSRTAPPGVALSPRFVVQPLQGLSGASSAWQSRWIAYAYEPDQALLRRVEFDPHLEDVHNPHLPTPAELPGLLQNGAARVLARGVQAFAVRAAADDASLLTLALTLQDSPELQVSFRLRSPGL